MRGELEELRDYTIFDESVDVYSYDGFPLVRGRPKAVILPRSVEAVSYTHLTLPTIYSV